MKTRRFHSHRLLSYVSVGAGLFLSLAACQTQPIVDSNFDATGHWTANSVPLPTDATKTALQVTAHYGKTVLGSRLVTSHQDGNISLPTLTSTFQASFDKSTKFLKLQGLLGFLSPNSFPIRSGGDGSILLSDDLGIDQPGYHCNLRHTTTLSVSFHNDSTMDFSTIDVETFTSDPNFPTNNCTQFLLDKINPGAKFDESLKGLVDLGVLDPNKLDSVLDITITSRYTATKDAPPTM